MVVTFIKYYEQGYLYGLKADKGTLTACSLKRLWEYVNETFPTLFYMTFELLLKHVHIYEQLFKVCYREDGKTFNGLPCERLTIDMKSRR